MKNKNCKVCKCKLTDDIAIACDSCDLWLCYDCLSIPKYLFEAISKFGKEGGDMSHLFISCKTCMVSVMPISAIKKGISVDAKVISDKIDALSLSVEDKVENVIKKLEKKLDDEVTSQVLILKEAMDTNGKTLQSLSDQSTVRWADIVKRSDKSDAALGKVEVAISKTAKQHVDLQEREKAIMLYKKEESSKDNIIDRNSDDLTYVKNFISNGLHLSEQPIQSCFRVGQFSEGKNRPIRVTFCSKASQVAVITNLSALRVAEECYKKVSVTVDRTETERESFRAKVAEAKKKSHETGQNYVVRGTYTPSLVLKK